MLFLESAQIILKLIIKKLRSIYQSDIIFT